MAETLSLAVEALAIIAGVTLLAALGLPGYIPALIAAVVGVHFLGFVPWWHGFAWLGLALIAAGILGGILGVAGLADDAIAAAVGICCAAALFYSAARAFSPSNDRPVAR